MESRSQHFKNFTPTKETLVTSKLMRRSLLLSLVLVGFTGLVPQGASAGTDCTDGYMLCINEAAGKYDDWGRQHFDIIDDLAYAECAAGYVGCVRRKLLGF